LKRDEGFAVYSATRKVEVWGREFLQTCNMKKMSEYYAERGKTHNTCHIARQLVKKLEHGRIWKSDPTKKCEKRTEMQQDAEYTAKTNSFLI